MTSDAQAILRSWSFPIGVNVSLFLTALVYTRGWLRLRAVFPNLIPAWRLAAFFAGILSVWIAIGSPVEAFDELSLTIHMVQHLLLMTVAPPLILLGAPALPLLRGLPESMARGVASPILRSGLVKWFARLVTHPALCWFVATFALVGWHVPAVFDFALRWDWLHEIEHACFFATGLLFWWPVVQPWPSTARWPRWFIPVYLFCATFPCDILSGFLAFCDRVVYSSYLTAPRLFNMSPLQDQECAAALMWTCVTVILLVPAVIVTLEILSPGKTHQPGESWVAFHKIGGDPLDASKLGIS